MVCRSLVECLAEKFGYENVEELKKDGKSRFSLVEDGILDKPCAKMLLANVRFRFASRVPCTRLMNGVGHQ